MSGTAEAQTQFDKGLRGPPSEQLATISKLSRLFEENPAPTFVNSLLLRVADAFKDGSLDLRVAIARSLSQCGSHLTLAFSSPEIFRRILTVSHSNDPSARETVLDVIAELSPLIPESNQCHHLIRESLSTNHEGEFRATCHALKKFASISRSFSESIVLQIGKVLEEDEASESRKVLLCSAFSTMSATTQVVEQVFGIADTILQRTISDEYFHAFIDSTTSLCIEIRYAISKQINLLLSLLNPTRRGFQTPTKTRRTIILKQLKRLAGFPNIWSEEQIKIFVESMNPDMADRSLMDFFDASTCLSKNCPNENLVLLKKLVVANTGFGSHANPEVSVRFVYFATQVFCSSRTFDGESTDLIESTMMSFAVVVVSTCTCGRLKPKLASKLYRAIGDFLLAFPYTQYTFSSMIISALFSAFESASPNDNNQKERLELLCRLVDTEKSYIPEINNWACQMMNEKSDLFDAYPSLFSYLVLSVGISHSKNFPEILYEESDFAKYETAKSALRNGHWKNVASANLNSIEMKHMSSFEKKWMTALREIADSQLTVLGLDQLDNQQERLVSAISCLKSAKAGSRFSSDLRFPLGITSAMLSSSYANFHVVSVLQPFLTVLSGALQSDVFYNPVMAKRFLTALAPCEASINEALAEWSTLCKASFCADSTSFDLITLYYIRVSVLLVAVRVVLKRQSPDTIVQIPPMNHNRTCSLLQKEGLEWVIEKIKYLRYESYPNIKTVKLLYTITEQLATIPYMLPRFFFQQFYHMDFKISTTPQAETDKPISVTTGETIPIRVDGAITSTHPSHFRSIHVFADVFYHSNQSMNRTLKEVVDPTDNQYFTAQFLLNFKGSCDVKFRIEFVDQITRKQWQADGGLTLPIVIRGQDFKRATGISQDPRAVTRNPQMMFNPDM